MLLSKECLIGLALYLRASSSALLSCSQAFWNSFSFSAPAGQDKQLQFLAQIPLSEQIQQSGRMRCE